MQQWILSVVAVGGLGTAALGDIINVPEDFPTIQAAILAALEGDEIVVAPGVYNEAVFFNGHNITLRSSDGPAVTMIDGTGISNHTLRVILGEGPTSLIEGFTVTGATTGGAAGLSCSGSSPTVVNCRFTANQMGGELQNFSNANITDCIFADNSGAGLVVVQSSPSIANCEFHGNAGGGMSLNSSSSTITNCTIHDNTATGNGGGALVTFGSPSFVNCLFFNNFSDGSTSGAMFINSASPTLVSCTLSDNGGGIGNSGELTLINCVIWDNGASSLSGSDIAVSYCDIEFGWPGSDFSILADPMFVDPAAGDYRLAAGSPCIDSGSNAAVPAGVSTDLGDNPRFVDDPDTGDCPQPGADCGVPPVVDMGAFEFQPPTCPWDLDGNGDVGTTDFLDLLAQWGTDPGGPPDFDGDGTVGVLDFLTILAEWGPCE